MTFGIELFVDDLDVSIEFYERALGVEIVLEVPDVDATLEDVERAGFGVVEPSRGHPWGLRDVRVVDPDGYDVRVTTR